MTAHRTHPLTLNRLDHEIDPETAVRIAERALREGITPEVLIAQLLRKHFEGDAS